MKKIITILVLLSTVAILPAYKSPASDERQANKEAREKRKREAKWQNLYQRRTITLEDCKADIGTLNKNMLALKGEVRSLQRKLVETQKKNNQIARQVLYLRKVIKDAGLDANEPEEENVDKEQGTADPNK